MSRFSYCSLALLAALTVSSGAYARAAHSNPTFPPGVRASVTGTSEADIQRQWSEQARARWGRTARICKRRATSPTAPACTTTA